MEPTFVTGRRAIAAALAKAGGVSVQRTAENLYGPMIAAEVTKATIDVMGTTGTGAELLGARASNSFTAPIIKQAVLHRLGATPVPGMTRLSLISAMGPFAFVGERAPIAVYAPSWDDTVFLESRKASGIVGFDNELLAAPEAPAIIENASQQGLIAGVDMALLDPTQTDDGTRPAAITAGLTPIDGSSAVDVAGVDAVVGSLLGELVAAGSNMLGLRFVANVATVLALSLMRTADGVAAYPGLTPAGGVLGGVPLLATGYGPANQLTLVDGPQLLLADTGRIEVTVAREAALDFSSVPEGNTRISLFQTETTAIRSTWWVNWKLRRPTLCAYAHNFAPPLPSMGSP